jgi:hypothetical protein
MVTVWKLGQMVPVMKETMNMGKNMAQELLNGLIPQCLLVNFIITIFMEKVFICGVMGVNMRANGKIIKCMGRAVLVGLMEEFTLVNILMIRKMGMVNFSGQMEEVIKEIGQMASNMEKVCM